MVALSRWLAIGQWWEFLRLIRQVKFLEVNRPIAAMEATEINLFRCEILTFLKAGVHLGVYVERTWGCPSMC